ncbi:sulfatase [Verrucomicrobiaceae bacterium N1E253]|uniref:Sulfatase n=1 Tax=Oceaniferula marina TaxID=2748318 RepID=A0A851GBI8_9BACT|nr:sulfatase [Oceaniferula marina]
MKLKKWMLSALYGGILLAPSLQAEGKYNVLFVISDDLTATALSCYENDACQTPNIDSLAKQGTRYTRTFCQFPVCGPSRASLMTGYYPHATGVMGYTNGRKQIGDDRLTWSQYFAKHGYFTARVSKIYHMGVPGDIVRGSNGADDEASWMERYNSQGPEVMAPGEGERLQDNPNGGKPYGKRNHLEYVKADGDDLVHSDGKTAAKACELIKAHKDKRFFLAVGFVRPHVPFVAPKSYYEPYPWQDVKLPPKVDGDWDDIPKMGINYRTSKGMQLNLDQEKKAIAAYYASVSFMDTQFGKVMQTLKDEGLEDKTIVIFTSDHGFHLGEHDFWMKVGLMDESSRVPMIIKVPGQKPGVCESFTELIDLYPTVAELCGLEIPKHIQGESLAKTIQNPSFSVRDMAFSVNGRSFLLRSAKWSFIQHGENASGGMQLYDMEKDPGQFKNLAKNPEYTPVVKRFQSHLAEKLAEVRDNDLDIKPRAKKKKATNKAQPKS